MTVFRGADSGVIRATDRFVDRYGREWNTAPEYQDRNHNQPGWLLLQTAEGKRETFSNVVDLYGFLGSDGVRFLQAWRT